MHNDERSLKIWIDGSAFKNPGGESGYAGIIEWPEALGRPFEIAFTRTLGQSTNNRMELMACVRALEHVRKNRDTWRTLGIHRIQIVTDSDYVYGNRNRPATWRKTGWRGASGAFIENIDLWKRYLVLQGVGAEIVWHRGKTHEVNKLVDKLAKEVAKLSLKKKDYGYRPGATSRAGSDRSAAQPFPANGQTETIKILKRELEGIGNQREQKISFFLYNSETKQLEGKFYAYLRNNVVSRHHWYTVKFGGTLKYPIIEEISEAEIG